MRETFMVIFTVINAMVLVLNIIGSGSNYFYKLRINSVVEDNTKLYAENTALKEQMEISKQEKLMVTSPYQGNVVNFPHEGQTVWCATSRDLEVKRLDNRSVWIKCHNADNSDYTPPDIKPNNK